MNETAFSFDPDWMGTLTAPFMTNAFLAGLCIALAAGVMGYFIPRSPRMRWRTSDCQERPEPCCWVCRSVPVSACSLSAEHW